MLSFNIFFVLINPCLSFPNRDINEDLDDSKRSANKSIKEKIKIKKFPNIAYLQKKLIRNNKKDFKEPIELMRFLSELSANLEDKSNSIENSFVININSNKQSKIGTKLIAEGDVLIKSFNGIMKAKKLSYDEKLKTLIIEGKIYFKTKTHFLEAQTIEYDFIKKFGFILNAYGSIELNSLNQISKNKNNENLNENFTKDFKIKSVKLNNTSNIKLEKKNNKFNAKLNPINRIRFKSNRIEINNDVWSSAELKLTNDPFNEPQLVINNRNFKYFTEDNKPKIKTKWSSLTFEDKLTIPIGPRNINLERENYSLWGVAYDKKKYDGLSIYRSFNPLFFGKEKSTQINLISKFNIQRMLSGETKSFSLENEDILGDKIKQDANLLDYFAIDTELTSFINGWNYILKAETNSADYQKLNKSLEVKSYLTKNIYLKNDYNFFAKGDISFFGTFREKTKNGSLGEILVNKSYGALYEHEIIKNKKNNTKVIQNINLGFGKYESPSRINSKNLISNQRLNLSLKQKNEYVIWQPKSKNYLNRYYLYTPSETKQGLLWMIEGKADFLKYDYGNKQDIISIKTGPKLVFGSFMKDYLDYTEIEIYPRFKFSRGNSPFIFDQVVDSRVIEFNIKQQLYKALALNLSGEFDLKNNSRDNLINPTMEISWNRRAYNVGLFYNFDNQEGGINFDIYSFDFIGLGRKFK